MKRRVGVMIVAALSVALASAACAGERIERFLPAHTLMYGGVEKLQAGYDKVMGALHRTLPDFEELEPDHFIRQLAREFDLVGVGTREEFLAATGLDPDGGAGIAWVLTDPTVDPGRNHNENALVILPVKDAARVEQLLGDKILQQTLRETESICRSTIQRIQRSKDRWKQANPDAGQVELTWELLAKADPGLKPLRCPGGGEYAIGGPNDEPTCTVHTRGGGPRFDGPFTRQGLGIRAIGPVTLVGGRRKGTGYAVTKTHIVFSNNMNVLEDAANAYVGEAPRAAMAPPGPGFAGADGRAYFDVGLLLDLLRHEIERWAQRRPSPAVGRLYTLFAGAHGLTADLRLTDTLDATLTWQITRNPQTARVLDTKPSPLEALTLVPDDALAAWGTNLGREAFSVVGDIAMVEDPRIAGAVRLVMAGADGDGVFALTQGALEGEVPNMLFILKARDREVLEAAAETWLGVFGREFREREYRLHEQTIANVKVWSLEGLRRGTSFHYGVMGPYVVFGSKLDDVRAVIETHAGQRKNTLVASERYRKLGLADGPTNVVSFVDMPALCRQIWAGEHERRIHWRNERCRQNMQQIERAIQEFRQQQGRLPQTFEELRNPPGRGRRRNIQNWCQVAGEGVRLTLDPNTGKVTCPRHGTVAAFRPIDIDVPRQVREEELILSAFGLWALRIHVEGDQIKARGRLIPAPQRRPKPRPQPPRPPGPAEF